jgi:hypothetical protein
MRKWREKYAMPSSKVATLLTFAGLVMAGCASVQSNAFVHGERRAPRPEDAPVLVLRTGALARPYTPVATLNVHIEKTFFLPTAFDEARVKLEALARQHGADAPIDFKEERSRLNETFIYNVSAVAVVYTDP